MGSIPKSDHVGHSHSLNDGVDSGRAPPDSDLLQIWRRNASVPTSIDGCVHELIAQSVATSPNVLAVCAWDGDLTYAEFARLSDALAHRILAAGIHPKSTVPFLFSKSKWTSVAMLGIIKAGCAAVALDANHPDARLRQILQQVQPSVVVCSKTHRERVNFLIKTAVLQLDDDIWRDLEQSDEEGALPVVSPEDIAYVSFTSGTTGQPKGACISHGNVRSAIYYQGKALGFHAQSRVWDFAPYSFDVAWSNVLHSLCAGACLCVPNEQDMLDSPSTSIAAFGATLINVTPTMLRTITSIPPTLQTVLLSGEMPYRDNAKLWADRVTLINTYGPSECTWKCAFSRLTLSNNERPDLGYGGPGLCLWIVNANDNNQLAALGETGELYLEGPLVGQGYLANSAETSKAFTYDPPWLLRGCPGFPGRRGRLYKTGDLLKRNSDGKVVFVGRKDSSQLKIRGQRVEIGDVEHHVQSCLNSTLHVLVDMLHTHGSDTPSLTLFVQTRGESLDRVKTLIDDLVKRLLGVLPPFMIPSIYLPIEEIPIAATGKTNRKLLRDIGNRLTADEILELQSSILSVEKYQPPSTEIERLLCEICAEVLSLKVNRISTVDSFWRLGGDSITAMHVVAKFRQHGFSLSVADIYRNPVLRDLALATKVIDSISIECDEIPAFSLLESGKNLSVLEAAARSCHAHVEDIEDAYPCTPLQQGMLAVTLKSGTALGDAADYVARTVYELPSDVDLVAFEAAWSSVQETTPILQTQIVNVPGEGLIQVVMKPQVPLYRFNSLSEFIVGSKGMGLGTPLCRAGLIITGIPRFVLEMHHSLFDGWSMMLILDAIEASYRGETSPQLLFPFRSYIKHQIAIDERESILFWQQSLANGSDVRAFPSPTHASGRKSDFSHTLTKLAWPHSGITQSSIIRAALSLLIASYTNSSTVRFGATVSGRQAPIPNIERIAGPTIATVPVQTNVDRNQRLQEFFQQIQNHAVDAIKYEQFGLSRIEQCVDETDLFQLLLIVQPRQLEKLQQNGGLFNKANTVISALEANNTVNTVTKDGQDDTMGLYNPYAVMLICNLDETGVELKFNYDHGVIQKNEIQKIAQQLEHLLRCICDSKTASTLTLRDVTPLTEQDLAEIWMRNPALPETNIKPIVDTIHDRFNMKPESVVISGWDVELTAEELISQSLTLVHRLHAVGIRPGSLVILDFEKSAWFTVAMLAVLKLGAIALPMSSPVPKLRATQVVENLQPQLVIASTSAGNSAFDGLVTTISIMDLLATRFKTPASADSHPHRNHPTDPALILFTSGSTGTPKAILWTHATLSSNINTAVSSFNILDSTRTFQFAGYDFDVSVVEILATLSAGGCICVPHEADRKNRLAGSIKESRANWICLTPSVASTLDVASVTCLQTIVFAGERLENKTAVEWAEQIDMVYNWYGPVEASLATSCVVKPDTWIPGKIGRSYSGSTWLVDPNNPNQLAAVGAVAELYIEGPALASYVGISGPSLNDDGFLEPSWLREGHGKTPGRRGPIYRTGDLVKYGFDGSIIYIGRANDSQRKLRGQRIDLSEIEQHAKEFLESQMNVALVAEIFTPLQSDKEVLALFISPRAPIHTDDNINGYIQTHLPVDGLESHLYTLLPSYMIPKVYVPLAQIPIGTTGKTDRRQLRQLGGFLTLTDLALMQPARQKARKPDTWKEKKLQTIWADILGLNVDEIYATDHFLRLGGDSIAAMRLVGMVDAHGFQLTVTDVFQVPILQDMAEKMTRSTHIIGTDEILPFSLLAQSTSIIEVQYFSARECSVDESQVVDIYPCTSLQQGLLSLGTKTQGQYVSRSVLKLQAGIDPARLERAWRDTAQKLPILRTRIIDLPLHGLHQVVIYDIPWRSGSSIDDYLCADEQEPMGLGTELCRAAIVDLHFILTIHHCLYDGSSLQMILDELEAQYREKPGMVVTPFQLFIKNTSQVKPQDALDYWNTQLSRADFTSFPNLPSLKYEPQASGSLQRSIKIQWPTGTSTPSTILRAAWAILQGQYLATRDVIFGVTVSGRQSSVRGIENCVAPTIATVPVAVCMDRSESVESFLQRVQAQGLDMIPYEQYGLHNIQRAQNDRKNTLFNTLLVVQPVTTGKGLDADSFLFKSRSFASTQNIQGTDAFNIYALMIICQLTLSGLEVRISFDSNIIESRQANRLLAQFETVIHQLCTLSTETTTLGAIQTISSLDLEQLKLQSHHTPTYPTELIHDRMSSLATKYHTDPAINAWDGTFTYAELDAMSTALARRMIFHCGVTKGSVIALCFEKSKYTPVAQFAAWKAGAVTLLVSVDVPEQRMAFVFQHLNVYMALASPSCVDIAKQFTSCMTIEALMDLPIATICSFPTLEMEDPAATLVSSGSTGEPKHILWSHRALAANVSELINQLQPDPNWRVFQFSSYDFDVATLETAMALVSAACLCIPSESERLAKPGESFNHLGANLITLTPSTARFLSPKDVPNLQTLIFAGEKLLQEDVDRWKGHCRIFNWYGPCEFSTASICDTDAPSWNSGTIGHIQNSKCWLVDPFIPNRLVPVGAVGEILLTGPCCAEGYVRNKDLTEEYFLQNHPDFIAEKDSSCKSQGFTAYRTGDLARYDTNGNLVYVGRKDAQLKISGQLVAPKEVERHVHDNLHMYDDCLEVIVDSIMLSTGGDVALVAFLVTEKDMTEGLVDLNHKLQTVLPRYAIPSRYIPIVNIPLTPNGKRDRKEMSRIAEEFSPIEQSQYRRPPSTTSEMALAKLWSLTLGCDIEKVFATDSFLWAGSSIDAMRLVGIARQHGFLLTMADVFVQPILQDMAKRLQSLKDTPEEINEPFTLLGSEHDTKVAIQKAASSCGVEVEAIEDLFPCTQLQAGLLALTIKTPGDYTGRNVWQLAPSTDVEQFKKAWEQVVNTVPILRTSIVYIPDQGFLQAVTRHQNWWSEAKSLSEYLKSDDALPMHAGVPLMRCALIRVEDNVNSTTSPRHHFVLTMHHSIYDGHVMSLIMEVLQSLYHKETPIRLCPFQNFVKAIHSRDKNAEQQYWKDQFDNLEAVPFPVMSASTTQPRTDSSETLVINNLNWRTDGFTPSTIIRAAFALLCSQYSSLSDVVFGTVVMGRKTSIQGTERMAGPTIATVPVRVRIDRQQTVLDLLQDIQVGERDMIPYEQTGLSNIRQVSDEAAQACRFQSLLVVQPPTPIDNEFSLFVADSEHKSGIDRYQSFNSYALSVVCTIAASGLTIEFLYDSNILEPITMKTMAPHLEHILRTLCAKHEPQVPIRNLNMASMADLNDIWRWNAMVPESSDTCIHDLMTDIAQRHPDAQAVCAWDGNLTYAELDHFSTRIASHLVQNGVSKNKIVPLLFEKSMYAVLAIFSVIKAGGATLLLDPSTPDARIRAMLEQIDQTPMLASVSCKQRALQLVPNTLVLGPESELMKLCTVTNVNEDLSELPKVDPSDLLYVVFTSGSTGTPKGCLTQHRHFSSAVAHQRALFNLGTTSRMYDFSSHTFDSIYFTTFHVLASGATLCVPSDHERKNDLTGSVRRFRSTDVVVTPSTAKLMDPSGIPNLRNVYLGGEAVSPEDLSRWMPYGNVVNLYGPSECSAATIFWPVPITMDRKPLIGKGYGVTTWVVDPENGDRLSALGTVGELYLEGPLVGQGYLDNEAKTAEVFVKNPSWLLKGSPDRTVLGRQGRLYKTGDLVKYNTDTGLLSFVGRKDTQVKLRGQRIEISEIEHHVQSCISSRLANCHTLPAVVAEVITPRATGRDTLAVFIQCEQHQLTELLPHLETELPARLPTYMVPAVYVPVAIMPTALSGKTDRRRIREMGADLILGQLNSVNTAGPLLMPQTELERRLQKSWADVLGVPIDEIGTQSSFIRLGGDSISAIRLASLLRDDYLSLTVQSIMSSPRLSDMATSITELEEENDINVPPFSLLRQPVDHGYMVADVAKQCIVESSQVEDIFPCTSVQKSLLSMTAKRENSYIARFFLRLRNDIGIDRFKSAWDDVSKTVAPILRCRIVDSSTQGLVQVQLKEELKWETADNIDNYIKEDQMRPMGLAIPLTRLAIIQDSSSGAHCCFITQHHAVYDGYSLQLLVSEVSKAYNGVFDETPLAPFQAFMKQLISVDPEDAEEFWRREFADSEAIAFPQLPNRDYQPKADSNVKLIMEGFQWPKRDVTPSTLLRATLSVLISQYIDSEDVVFGAMVTGRQAALPGIDRMVAPLINVVPVRVKLDPQHTVDSLLEAIQKQSTDMIPYEQTELLSIRRINSNTDAGSRFNTLLIVQPPSQLLTNNDEDGPFEQNGKVTMASEGLDDFNPNAVMIMCQLTNTNGLEVEISFDSRVVDSAQMDLLAHQFEHLLRQICTLSTQSVDSIDALGLHDRDQLWKWNETVPVPIETCVHDMISRTIHQNPSAPAICAWDGELTYAELDEISNRLASHLVGLGAGPGTIIPLCFEKSMWHPVAALGIMKSGAACLSMDVSQPEARLQAIVKQVQPVLILSSEKNEILAGKLSDAQVVTLGKAYLQPLTSPVLSVSLPKVSPSDVLYLVFTSGSTGVPKGVVTTHQNFASAATHQEEVLRIRQRTRVFDFVSYSFDVSWSNTLQTLIFGGCLCIPSETERRNDIVGAFNRMQCDYAYFTPSVARSLDPSSLPRLRVLAMGGEPIPNTEVARWVQAEAILGIYGPAECAQGLTFTLLKSQSRQNYVGYSFGARTWLVKPGRPDCLAAIGTVGELLIEGPTVSQGYFRDSEKTAAAYIHNPPWLLQGAPGHLGRQGILYKTGDLLRYSSNGSLEFIGRKDGLVKLRGQRIELAEVEYHVRANLSRPDLCDGLAAEVITPKNSSSPILAVFLCLAGQDVADSDDSPSKLAKLTEGLEEKLSDCLPHYMVPAAYIPIDSIPMTTTNKTDRRTLRELGKLQNLESLEKKQSHGRPHRPPTTAMEKRLQLLWSSVLGMDTNSISADSSFFRIGGESIAAMRLVSAARAQQLAFTVADIFKAPRLSQLALLVTEKFAEEEASPHIQPFALLESDDPAAFLSKLIQPQLDPVAGSVQDVIPCTDFQVCALLDAMQTPPSRLPHWIFNLPADVDFSRLESSIQTLVAHFDILHSVFVPAKGRFWQVLLPNLKVTVDRFQAGDGEDITTFTNALCEEDRQRPRQWGHSFIRLMVVSHPSGEHRLVFRISHAQFDGFSWGAVLESLSSIYYTGTVGPTPAFSQYVSYKHHMRIDALEYWSSRLRGSSHPSWNKVLASPEVVYTTSDRLVLQRTIPLPDGKRFEGISTATVFHAACAIVLSRQFQQREVVFGRLVTGRAMLPSSLHAVVGPTMTEVPIRIAISPNDTLEIVAERLQRQIIEDAAYETVGMYEIIENGTNWSGSDTVRDFGWRTAFQQADGADFHLLGAPSAISFYEPEMLPRPRPEIYATPSAGKLLLEFEGNRKLISEEVVTSVLDGLEELLSK